MDPATTIAALAAMAAWIQLLIEEDRKLKAKEIKAVEALCDAVDETKLYVSVTRPPEGTGVGERDPEREMQIANLWRKSSDLIEKIDFQLAERLSTKSAFWENIGDVNWKVAHTKLAQIKLEDISREASKLRKKL